MLHSMTGYGKAACEYNNKKIVVEIKSLNSKSADISARIAPLYREKEIEIRTMVAQRIERGKVDLSIYTENSAEQQGARINIDMVKNYYIQFAEVEAQTGIKMPENVLEMIMRMPDVMKSDNMELGDDEWTLLKQTINDAIDALLEFRLQEGLSLRKVFDEKISNISSLLLEVDRYETERIEKIRTRIEENLKAIEDKIALDHNRLEQEMIFYIEKLDVNEEKNRLRNHLKYFVETMDNEHAPGKKMGFIAQEMGREINTLGSKSNHSEMQKIVVRMKDELEQIKEQVLNVL